MNVRKCDGLIEFQRKEIILFVNRQFFLNFQILLFSGGRQTGTFVGLNIKYLSSLGVLFLVT